MKTLRPDEILVYAKSQIAHAEQDRLATPVIIGLIILAIPVWGFYALKEDSDKLNAFLPFDDHFLLGVAFGVMFILLSLTGGVLVTFYFRRCLNGTEFQILKRLIELEQKVANKPSEDSH